MIHELKTLHPKMTQQDACRLLGISRQAHHKQRARSVRVITGNELVVQWVHAIRKDQPKLGGRKLHHLLGERLALLPVPIGRDNFFELLRQEHLLVRKSRRTTRTTMSRHGMKTYPDLIKDQWISAPGQVWVSDITYWQVEEGFYYIFLVTDACSHKAIGHYVARNMEGVNAMKALIMAQKNSPHALKGIIHHSDRGSQYCYGKYVKALVTKHMRISMTQSSDPRDNAIAERINGILKGELLEHHRVTNIVQARSILDRAIEIYNGERPHLSCDMQTPDVAHQLAYRLKQRWRNYYKPVNPMQDNSQIGNLNTDVVH